MEIIESINLAFNKIDGHVACFICGVYRGAGRVEQKIWTCVNGIFISPPPHIP